MRERIKDLFKYESARSGSVLLDELPYYDEDTLLDFRYAEEKLPKGWKFLLKRIEYYAESATAFFVLRSPKMREIEFKFSGTVTKQQTVWDLESLEVMTDPQENS